MKYQIGKFEAEIDATDADFLERYEAAVEKYNEDVAKMPKDGKMSEQMRCVCDIVNRTMDGIFGEGASDKMFGGAQSAGKHIEAFAELVRVMNDMEYVNGLAEKMGAQLPNREQRRKKK